MRLKALQAAVAGVGASNGMFEAGEQPDSKGHRSMTDTPGAREYTFALSDFGADLASRSGLTADARRLRSALLMRPTLQDSEFGGQLRRALQERLTPETTQGIRRLVQDVARVAIPGVNVERVEVLALPRGNQSGESVAIGITLGRTGDAAAATIALRARTTPQGSVVLENLTV